MPQQEIREPVNVLAIFKNDKIRPYCFQWRKSIFFIKSVNFVHSEYQGERKVYHFSVSHSSGVYELKLDSKSLQWELEKICLE